METLTGTTVIGGSGGLIVSSGKIGIGTGNPGTALEVYGSITSRTAITQDAIIISGRGGGTNSYAITLSPTTLTASRAITFPDAAGTVALTSDITGGASAGSFTNITGSGLLTISTATSGTSNSIILASANYSLPDPSTCTGRIYWVKNTNSSAITLSSSGTSKTIDGQSSITLAQYDAYTVVSNGTNWFIL